MPIDRCVQCGGTELARKVEIENWQVAGRTFAVDLPGTSCTGCGEFYVHGNDMKRAEDAIAIELAREGPASGEALRYMRKTIGMPAVELATLLDISPETLSRWENSRRQPDHAAWLAVGSLVLDHAAGRDDTLRRLRAAHKPRRGRSRVHVAA